ncbi:DUF6431 domain-containing protein [Streptomyces albireticuli]|uniref:DUF6431 domain-containing protein n=1 Tax=Streptomyces albireticuli TaxID=1940 RepID=UPI003AEFF98E
MVLWHLGRLAVLRPCSELSTALPRRLSVLIVDSDALLVERQLRASQLECPRCSSVLAPWGHGRPREIRGDLGARLFLRPRRTRCSGCKVTHMLLAEALWPRRADAAVVIGVGLASPSRLTYTTGRSSPPSPTKQNASPEPARANCSSRAPEARRTPSSRQWEAGSVASRSATPAKNATTSSSTPRGAATLPAYQGRRVRRRLRRSLSEEGVL